MIVASNSSPLIYLAALGDFELLRKLFGEIHVPPAVWTETVGQGGGFPVQPAALQAVAQGWLRVTPLRVPVGSIHAAGRRLHLGETEVIRLAEELSADIADRRPGGGHSGASPWTPSGPDHRDLHRCQAKRNDRECQRGGYQLRAARFRLSERDYKAILALTGEL